jgi:uncharacterized 2Fe-2S/4Fe-4S cluster protein (DUF4445 family)
VKRYRLKFLPEGKEIEVIDEESILEASKKAKVMITSSCGGEGTCGKCKIIIKRGVIESSGFEKLSKEELDKGYRLACLSKIKSDLEVFIPLESRGVNKELLKEEEKERVLYPESLEHQIEKLIIDPITKKYFLTLPPPDIDNNLNDLDRVIHTLEKDYKIKEIEVDFYVLEKIADCLRKEDFKVTVTILFFKNRARLINIEPGDTTKDNYSIVFDIGTTSIYGQIIDLNKGEVLSKSINYNAQLRCGEDIISRIIYALKKEKAEELQALVIETINSILEELFKESRIKREDVSHMVFSGNTTMMHLFLGVNPRYIREAPYVPAFSFLDPLKTKDFRIDLNYHAYFYLLPSVASYIGGDITSGVLATNIHKEEKLTLYIDVGTNGEIVLGNKEMLFTASCSAGPAFEGGAIKHGMIAIKGAIEEIYIDEESLNPVLVTIGNERPKGICGSGLISAVAELLEKKIINQKGKFFKDIASSRIRKGESGYEYVLCYAEDTSIGKDIVLTEVDIDNLIRAKGAMYAGMSLLLKYMEKSFKDIEKVIIAGNLGENIDIERAITIGFLPELPLDKFIFIGNGSLLGATLFSLSKDKSKEAYHISDSIMNIELSSDNRFMEEYIASLFLPHTDESRFPMVTERLNRR